MTFYALDERCGAMFKPTLISSFGQLFIAFGANNAHISHVPDSEHCSTWPQLDIASLLVNFPCELGPIMIRYNFRETKFWTMFGTYSKPVSFVINFSCDLGQIITRYDFQEDRWSEQCLNGLKFDLVSILVNFTCELGGNNYQIWLSMCWTNDSEQWSNQLQHGLIAFLIK